MKKLILYALTMAISVSLLTSCTSKEQPTPNEETLTPTEQATEDEGLTVDSGPEISEESTIITKQVGEELYGFWDVPEDWITFSDLSGAENVLQYSDPNGSNITTSRLFEDDSLTKLDVANYYYATMEADGAEGVTGATVILDEREALQIYSLYPDEDVIWIVWVFTVDGEDKKVHMISVEGLSDSIFDVFSRMEDSYVYKK